MSTPYNFTHPAAYSAHSTSYVRPKSRKPAIDLIKLGQLGRRLSVNRPPRHRPRTHRTTPRCTAINSPNARAAATADGPCPSHAIRANRNAKPRTNGSDSGNSASTAPTNPGTSSTDATLSRDKQPGRHIE